MGKKKRIFNYIRLNGVTIIAAAVLIVLVAVCIAYDMSHVRLTLETNTGVTEFTLEKGEIPSLTEPVRDGYTFIGWFDENGEEYIGEAIISNTVLHAEWMPETHTVTFRNAVGTMEGQRTYEVSHNTTLAEAPTAQRFGYRFTGWYMDRNCRTEYIPGKTRITSDLTLWAGMTMILDEDPDLAAPAIYIVTSNKSSDISKYEYSACTVTVDSQYKKYCVIEASAQIRGRGNSTWDLYEKKPYRIKFDKKTDLFGMGAAKDWILLANSVDMSMMRNYMVYKMAQEFESCTYTTDCEFAHVYINGVYNGLYLVCEQIESGTNRVDIGDGLDSSGNPLSPEETGFLLECGNPGWDWGDWMFTAKAYKGVSIGNIAVKSPSGEVMTEEMYTYIQDYISDVNRAIGKNDMELLCELVEIDTFVDTFICNQIIKSGDMGWVFFAYKKPGGKLCLGPLWDYDQSSGISEFGGASYKGFTAAAPHTWYDKLIQNEAFRALVIQRWEEKKEYIHSLTDMVNDAAEKYSSDIDKNYERWDNFLGTKQWRSLPEVDALKTYPEHVEYFTTWIENRIHWIETELGIQ